MKSEYSSRYWTITVAEQDEHCLTCGGNTHCCQCTYGNRKSYTTRLDDKIMKLPLWFVKGLMDGSIERTE